MDQPGTSGTRRFRVGLCETQPATAEGVRSLVQSMEELECAWSVPQLMLALQLARQTEVDILLLDKHIGQQLVLRAVEDLRERCPATAVVVWGATMPETEALRFLQAGARGLLKKTASLPLIGQCLLEVARGATWVDGRAEPSGTAAGAGHSALTPREMQVLELVRQGLRNREIAAALGIRPGTVKIHLRHIFEKTGIHGRYLLALRLTAAHSFGHSRRAEVA